MCANPRQNRASSSATNPSSSPALSSRRQPASTNSRQRNRRKNPGKKWQRFDLGRGGSGVGGRARGRPTNNDSRYDDYEEYRDYDDAFVDYEFETSRRGGSGSRSNLMGVASAALRNQSRYQNGYSGRSRKPRASFSTKEFLKASCNFILKRSFRGDLAEISQVPWDDTLEVVCTAHEYRCPICLEETLVVGRITTCGHIFCGPCLLHHLVSKSGDEIPMNNGKYSVDDVRGKCPMCQGSISFGRCRPARIRTVQKYSVGDVIDFVLVKRKKFTNRVELPEDLSDKIGIFRVYQLESTTAEEFAQTRNELLSLLSSSHPVYEQPFMMAIVEQINGYIRDIKRERNSLTRSESSEKSDVEDDDPRYLSKYKFVFQSKDGQYIFLDSFNYGMLKAQFGHESNFPSQFSGRILEVFSYVQTKDTAARFPWQKFVPRTATIQVVEVDLRPLLTPKVFRQFEKKFNRHERARIDQREYEERVKQEEAEMAALEVAQRKAANAMYIPEEEFPDLTPTKAVERQPDAQAVQSPLQLPPTADVKESVPPMPPSSMGVTSWSRSASDPREKQVVAEVKPPAKSKKRRRRGRKRREKTPPLSTQPPPSSTVNKSWSNIARR